MKRLLNISLVIIILITTFAPVVNVYALTCESYKVSTVNSNGTVTDLSCYQTYDEAKIAMDAHNSDATSVAVIYNSVGTIINAKYAIAKFIPDADDTVDTATNKDDLIYLYTTPSRSQSYTYIEPSFGTDAAFLDYDPTYDMAKVKISGYTGWTRLKNIVISPITNLTSSFIRITASQVNVRESSTTSSTDVGDAFLNDLYQYYEKVNDATDTNLVWYRIKYNGNDAWIANNKSVGWLREWVFTNTTLQTFYEPYNVSNTNLINLRHKFDYYSTSVSSRTINLGAKPSYLTVGNQYYSFDGNYFYNNIISMLDDYKENKTTRAINPNNPHYDYYMYLPTRAKTGYTANDFNQIMIEKNFTSNIDPTVQYVKYDDVNKVYYFDTQVNRTGISLMYGKGQDFVDAANTYGVNGLMMFGTALNESGRGTSLIAFLKKNLFGLGAIDGDPVNSARSYTTVRDSIFDYARLVGSSSSSYTHPSGSYYFGSHYGNKGSGMNVYYASDPYWGEKQAANSYSNDLSYGLQDYDSSTIGVTNKDDVSIYKDTNSSSAVIYKLKNKNVSVKNIPLIVIDKIYTTENNIQVGWYKVYTDTALDDNQNMADVTYEFSKSYGYIKADDLYVANNQPVISATNVSIKTGQAFNYYQGVTATDIEDGDLTSRIQVTGSVDTYTTNVYYLTYTVEDNAKFQVTKKIQVVVVDTDDPIIMADDREVSQYSTYDPLKGIKVVDKTDGDLTPSLIVTSNNVNTSILGTNYQVTYQVTNSIGKKTIKTINICVVGNKNPVIVANDRLVNINTIFEPMLGVGATDYEDGIITNKITITSNNLNIAVAGTYQITYSVIDNAGNTTSKTINITVEDKIYTSRKGSFYFNKLLFENNKLVVEGSLAIMGMDNLATTNITYDLIIKSSNNVTEYVLPLNRWITNHPTRVYTDNSYNYTDSWFNGSVDLSGVPQGEYTLYVRARSGIYESINLFRNIFGKTMTRNSFDTVTGRGYQFRNNNYLDSYPIELFIRDSGLLSNTEPPHQSNMYNNYTNLDISNGYLNIVGKSYNMNGDYSTTSNVMRYLILENKATYERFNYEIGSFVGTEVPMRVSDGLSKVRAWFDTTNKIDLTKLSNGNYVIYIRTRTGAVNDFGELNDIFLKGITNPLQSTTIKTVSYNGKVYTISINLNARFRLELNIQ